MNEPLRIDAIVDVKFRTTAEGGRQGPVIGPDYRPQFHVPSWTEGDLGCFLFPRGEPLQPGGSYRLPLAFIAPELAQERRVAAGDRFLIREGSKVVAEGTIVELRL